MSCFICPICAQPLEKDDGCYRCSKKHSFDIAKSGYVNLLMSQQGKSKRHGDDKKMIQARFDFLDKGYYNPLADELIRLAETYFPQNGVLLDAGCGECWYSAKIYKRLEDLGRKPSAVGIDISKNALDAAKRRCVNIERAVASLFKLPLADASCDMALNIFSPYAGDEYRRVLKDGGKLITVVPLARHLFDLKAAVYEKPYENVPENRDMQGYELSLRKKICGTIELQNNEDILNLFMMTPYYYKTGVNDFEKLKRLERLRTQTEFEVCVYTRRCD